jgi:hypothetical protein
MNSHIITTISLIAAASIIAATIAVGTFTTSASALRVAGAPQANGASNQANENGLQV